MMAQGAYAVRMGGAEMDFSPEFWAAAGVIVAILALGGQVLSWRQRKRDSTPKIAIDIQRVADFPGYRAIPEGSYNTLTPPDPYLKPIPTLMATVSNDGTLPVTISGAGICLECTRQEMALPDDHRDQALESQDFPHRIPPRDVFRINIQFALLCRMLAVIGSRSNCKFTVWVAEPNGKRYSSAPQKTADYIGEGRPIEVAIGFESQVTVEQVGEEEYFPEGIFPGDSTKTPPGGGAS